MKLLVRKLWFPHSVDETLTELFRIPQVQEQFDEGYVYDREMRPRGIKICYKYWPAAKILDMLPYSEKDVYLALTSMDLKGDYGRVQGKGSERRVVASTDGLAGDNGFHPDNVYFNALIFGEVGHALGLQHHDYDPSDPCEMSHNKIPGPEWSSIDSIHFCNDCYSKIRS